MTSPLLAVTRTTTRRWPGVAYLAATGLLALVLAVLAAAGRVPGWALLVVAIPLGPLGPVWALLLGALALAGNGLAVSRDGVSSVPAPLAVIGVAVLVAGAVGLAALYRLVAAALLRAARRRPPAAAHRGPVRSGWDRVLAIGAFVDAGAAFVVLCVIGGIVLLTAGGIDLPVPAARAHLVSGVAGGALAAGAVAAFGGLALWPITWARGRASLPWAVLDLLVQLAAIAAVFTISG